MKGLAILFGAGFTVVTCAAAGALLLQGLRVRLYREEERLFAFLSGAAIVSTLVFLLTAMSQARTASFLLMGAVLIALAWWKDAWRSTSEKLPPLPRFWQRLFWSVYCVYGIIYFFNAMAPEHSPDGSTYHLGLVATYFREHSFPRITTNMYASLSQGTEMLFLLAFAFGRHSAASMVHFAFLMVLPLAMVFYARRLGMPAAGVCGALLVFCSPVLGIAGTSAYNDVAVATFVFGVFYLLSIWDGERKPELLVLAGLLCGFCYACKYTAFVAVPYALGFVLWKLIRSRQPVWRPLATLAVCAGIMMAPWLVKNWIFVANPVAPFFNRFFPNPYMHIRMEEVYRAMMRQYAIENYWRIPWELTVRGGVLQGLLGPIFLLAPIAIWALRSRVGRAILFAALVFGVSYSTNIGTRFLIPALPFIALAMALAATSVRGAAVALVLTHALLSLPFVLPKYSDRYAWRLNKVPYRAALRLESEESYLRANLSDIDVVRMMEGVVPPDGKVFGFNDVPLAYTSRNVLVAYQAAKNNTLGDILRSPLIPSLQPRTQYRFRFAPQKLRRIRVVQTAPKAVEEWSVNEFRVQYQGKDLPRAPEWRISAAPNPWDVGYAFDNSAVTRWRSWQGIYPGMFLEVDFSSEMLSDIVLLDCDPEQGGIQMKLEVATPSGEWRTLSDAPEVSETAAPASLRRAAVDELKAHGIDYLIVTADDFAAQDYKRNPTAWGLVLRGEKNGTRLYGLN